MPLPWERAPISCWIVQYFSCVGSLPTLFYLFKWELLIQHKRGRLKSLHSLAQGTKKKRKETNSLTSPPAGASDQNIGGHHLLFWLPITIIIINNTIQGKFYSHTTTLLKTLLFLLYMSTFSFESFHEKFNSCTPLYSWGIPLLLPKNCKFIIFFWLSDHFTIQISTSSIKN